MIEGISSSTFFITLSELSGGSISSDNHQKRKNDRSQGVIQNHSKKDNDTTGLRLTEEQKKEVEELKKRDQEVRTHEQAHIAVGGSLASAANYSTTKGPDNKQYAVGGEVQIDTSPVDGNPEKTIEKAQKIRSAATAPANPSGQDMQVASQASQMEAQAQIEKKQKQPDNKETTLNTQESPIKKGEEATTPTDQYKASSITNYSNKFSANTLIAGFFGTQPITSNLETLNKPELFSLVQPTTKTMMGNIFQQNLMPEQQKHTSSQNAAALYSQNTNQAKNSFISITI